MKQSVHEEQRNKNRAVYMVKLGGDSECGSKAWKGLEKSWLVRAVMNRSTHKIRSQ